MSCSNRDIPDYKKPLRFVHCFNSLFPRRNCTLQQPLDLDWGSLPIHTVGTCVLPVLRRFWCPQSNKMLRTWGACLNGLRLWRIDRGSLALRLIAFQHQIHWNMFLWQAKPKRTNQKELSSMWLWESCVDALLVSQRRKVWRLLPASILLDPHKAWLQAEHENHWHENTDMSLQVIARWTISSCHACLIWMVDWLAQ